MKKLARLALVATMALTAAVPAVAGHTPKCETDPILAVGATLPPGNDAGCTHPKTDSQHCDVWVQSDAVLKDGSCNSF